MGAYRSRVGEWSTRGAWICRDPPRRHSSGHSVCSVRVALHAATCRGADKNVYCSHSASNARRYCDPERHECCCQHERVVALRLCDCFDSIGWGLIIRLRCVWCSGNDFAQAEIVLKDLPSVVGVEASIAAAIGTMLTLMIVPRARTPTETLYQGFVFVFELLGQIGRVDWGNGAAAATPLMRLLGADSNFTTNGAPSVEYLGPQSRPRFIDSIRAGSLAADFRDLSAATVTLLENLYDILARSG